MTSGHGFSLPRGTKGRAVTTPNQQALAAEGLVTSLTDLSSRCLACLAIRLIIQPLQILLDKVVTHGVTSPMNSAHCPRLIALTPLDLCTFARFGREESALTDSPSFFRKNPPVTPLESALTDTPPVSPLECALTKKQGGWGWV